MRLVSWSGINQIHACMASAARTPVRLFVTGESSLVQCAPPSVVRRMVPELPTTQQTLADGADPASKSVLTPLVCSVHLRPLSDECSREPDGPTRQRCFPSGATNTWGFCSAAVRIMALV